jgi:3-hydroxyacyl-[acyl-carrier-protein] dehydratase
MQIEVFILVDRIRSLSIEDGIVQCESAVPVDSSIYLGHFPGHPILPGVLLIEAMAQTAGWLILAMTRCERFPFLSMVNNAKLRDFVTPGTQLLIEARMLHEGSGFARTSNRVLVDGKVKCEAETTFRVLPFPSPVFKDNVISHARRVGFPVEFAPHAA